MTLSVEQHKFLANRLILKTDRAAAAETGVSEDVVTKWKQETEFRDTYAELGKDGIELAKSILRQHLAKAALVLVDAAQEAVNKDGVDYSARISAAVKVLQSHGVIMERRVLEGNKDNPVVIELSADDLHEAIARARRKSADSGSIDN